MAENTTTKERVLTIAAQKAVRKWEDIYGTLRLALSAGVMALSYLSSEEREKCMAEANQVTLKKEENSMSRISQKHFLRVQQLVDLCSQKSEEYNAACEQVQAIVESGELKGRKWAGLKRHIVELTIEIKQIKKQLDDIVGFETAESVVSDAEADVADKQQKHRRPPSKPG